MFCLRRYDKAGFDNDSVDLSDYIINDPLSLI